MDKYIVVSDRPWSKQVFDQKISKLPGEWHFLVSLDHFGWETIQFVKPKYIFFLHWSQIVPKDIVEQYTCICFHPTALPYGRGGSPVQNMIFTGHEYTRVTMFKMTNKVDAGPWYDCRQLSLLGTAEEIYLRMAETAYCMIENLIRDSAPQFIEQDDREERVVFKRRKPEQSKVLEYFPLDDLFRFIQMLDAEGYPKAFFEYAGFRFELSRASLKTGRLLADVTITEAGEK